MENGANPEKSGSEKSASANTSAPTLRSIYNYPVVPEESEHYQQSEHKPLTRREMKCDFRNAIFMKHPDSQACWQALLDYKLASCIFCYTTHWIKTTDGRMIHGWRENFKKLADAGVYLCYVGLGGSDEEVADWQKFLLGTFGEQYIGAKADSELDGGYTSGWHWDKAGIVGEPEKNRSRRQAHDEYDRVLDYVYGRSLNHGMSIVSLGYGVHYAAEHGARMLGHEAGESLPSDTMVWAFVRGASKQYDLLTVGSISVPTRWGQKFYTRDGTNIADTNRVDGPDYGHTEGLIKREWYLAYMCGASLIMLQIGLFPQAFYEHKLSGDYEPFIMAGGPNNPGPGLLEANLTPMGRIHVDGQEFAVDHPTRGTPYMPVALMLDYDHGWNPPRHLYRGDENHVWCNIPYARGDYQIDNFFRWVYPDYQHSSYYRDERGYITNTPYGDMYEVILSNASPKCLSKYRVIMLLGEFNVASHEGLAERLTDFLHDGGVVVAGTDQWPDISASLAGAELSGAPQSYSSSVLTSDGKSFLEAEFEYQPLQPGADEVLLQAANGAPLVLRNRVGNGLLYLVTVCGWGKTEKRHDFLKGIKHVLGELLKELNLVEIEGRPIYYLVNVTDQEDELVLTLINNSPDTQWEGKVRIKGEQIEEVSPWLGHSEVGVQDGVLFCPVPASGVRIFKLKTDQSFLHLAYRDIDWEKLGIGIPEVNLKNCPARRPSHF